MVLLVLDKCKYAYPVKETSPHSEGVCHFFPRGFLKLVALSFSCALGDLRNSCTRHRLCRWQPISFYGAHPIGDISFFPLLLGYKNSRNQIAPIAAIDMIMNYVYNASKIFLALASTLYSYTICSDLILWARASSKEIRHRPPFLVRIDLAMS